MAETWYSVSPRLKPKRRLPKPMEKVSTRMPQSLATAKWPNSWTRTMMPRTMASSKIVDMGESGTSFGWWLLLAIVERRWFGGQSLRAHILARQDQLEAPRG